MACAGPREDGADPLERVSHSRQASRIPLKRKREAGDDTDVRPTSLPRRGEIAAFHTAACDADAPTTPPTTPRAESRREPTVEQLTDYGRWLGRTEFGRLAALREQQCARLWKLVASARRGKVDPDFCLHVARDNTLAQRNGYGLALMFLDGSVPPEENARRLDGYFFALGAASAPTHAEPHRQVRGLEQCVEMAACYLFKTRWFMDAPLEKLAELGNLLSKYPRQPASMAAIAWIAGQALEARAIARLGAKALTLLANAFSKNGDSGRCEQATARIGRYLLHDGGEDLRGAANRAAAQRLQQMAWRHRLPGGGRIPCRAAGAIARIATGHGRAGGCDRDQRPEQVAGDRRVPQRCRASRCPAGA